VNRVVPVEQKPEAQKRAAALPAVALNARSASAEEVLRWAVKYFPKDMALASSFGAEDQVLLDLTSKLNAPLRVFTLDTGFLFPATYSLIAISERKYGVQVERAKSALTPGQQEEQYGPALWSRDPDQCCDLRKVVPLKSKLGQLRAWVTGIRRDQAPARANAKKVEWDQRFGLVKFNPLVDWTWDQVWAYIRANQVPYNPLHDRNYPSIGCRHCTRQVMPGEDLRAGRWAGQGKIECGLHLKTGNE
jgi:phosphoadenosine phosphosulfate reductase